MLYQRLPVYYSNNYYFHAIKQEIADKEKRHHMTKLRKVCLTTLLLLVDAQKHFLWRHFAIFKR